MNSVQSIIRPVTLVAAALWLWCAPGAWAQGARPPKAQLWIDLSTGGMAGMPEMDLPMGGGAPPGMGGQMHYGMARGMAVMPPRVVDIAFHNSLRPGVPEEYGRDKPRGRLLVYWGCGPEVRAGQPRVIDLAQASAAQFAQAFAGRVVPERGARVGPGHALYPNERSQAPVPRGSSLVGAHQVLGEGVPVSMKFSLGSAQDLMPPIELSSSGRVQDSILTQWQPVPHARAYYLHALSQAGDDMILWSSAETPDTGMGLFDYLPNATQERWVRERVLLDAQATQCAIPRGIFAAGGRDATPMLRMMAYGGESHFAHPPRPADPKARWEPDWAVRVRVKSHTMAMLGEEGAAAARGGRSGGAAAGAPGQGGEPRPEDSSPAQILLNSGNLLRGIFGR